MPNSYFRFKQFTVSQKNCAMKVTTDACILGALSPVEPATNILDIGAGTGLLSLMVAQRSSATVTALELDSAAFKDCIDNFKASPWRDRLTLIHTDFVLWALDNITFWDTIICNPPFFTNQLPNPNPNKRMARHTDGLDAETVISFAAQWLSDKGTLSLLLPAFIKEDILNTCLQKGLHIKAVIMLKDTTMHSSKRFILTATRNKQEQPPQEQEFIIKESNTYAPDFKQLLSPYYLYM